MTVAVAPYNTWLGEDTATQETPVAAPVPQGKPDAAKAAQISPRSAKISPRSAKISPRQLSGRDGRVSARSSKRGAAAAATELPNEEWDQAQVKLWLERVVAEDEALQVCVRERP